MDPREEAFAEGLAQDPYDLEVYRVYGDWLSERGDPRGQLIQLHLAAEKADASKRLYLDRVIRKLYETHQQAFAGGLPIEDRSSGIPKGIPKAGKVPDPFSLPSIDWRFGFIHEATLSSAAQLEQLLRHPSGRFLVRLQLATDDLAVLARGEPRTLRALELSSSDSDLGRVWSAHSRLRELSLRGAHHGSFVLPELTKLALGGSIDLGTAVLPSLEVLQLDLRGLVHSKLWSVFLRDDLPKLRKLRLLLGPSPGAVFDKLGACPLMQQITELALPMTTLDNATAQALVRLNRQFDRLTVYENRVTSNAAGYLARIAKRVDSALV